MEKIHPRLTVWAEIGGVMFAAGERLAEEARRTFRRRRWQSYSTVRPGAATPYWNIIVAQLRIELVAYGSKARFARFLGVPRQRLNDYLTGRSRMPDAELTLRMLHWLAEKRAGRDLSK